MTPANEGWDLNCDMCEFYKKNFCTRKKIHVMADEYCIYFTELEGLTPGFNKECGNCQFFSRKFCTVLDVTLNTKGWCKKAKIRQGE
jgi:hypothetical protein